MAFGAKGRLGKIFDKKVMLVIGIILLVSIAAFCFYTGFQSEKSPGDLEVKGENKSLQEEPEKDSSDTGEKIPVIPDGLAEPEKNQTQANTVNETANDSAKTGTLSIHSNPSKAAVLIDNESAGENALTPTVIYNVSTGYHTVSFEKQDYLPYSVSVKVIPDRITPVEANLTLASAQFGVLNITTIPDQALVYLDNQLIGTTPLIFNATVEYHLVRLEKEGHASYAKRVYTSANKVISMNVTLTAK